MKTTFFYKLFAQLLAVIIVIGCVQDGQYDVPIIEVEAANIDLNTVITINAMSNEFEQALLIEANNLGIDPTDAIALDALRQSFKLSFENNTRYIEGFVISNDAAGNFFEELILQDKSENPNRGVKILINTNPLYSTYQFGRRVFVKIEGLTAGYDSGVLTLGIRSGNNLEKIGESQQPLTI